MSESLQTGSLETGNLSGPQKSSLGNPLEDLREFAKTSLAQHEMMQAATRRELSARSEVGIRRSFIEMPAPRAFADPPQKRDVRGIPQIQESGGTSTSGAFYNMYVDGDGDTYLQGGQVTSGTGNFVIADLKVIDSGAGITEANGDILVLEVTVDGYVVDGVLLAGLTATAASYISPSGTSVSSNTLPVIGAHTGRKVYIEIGRWAADNFFPASPGNIRISFCPGAYNITRF